MSSKLTLAASLGAGLLICAACSPAKTPPVAEQTAPVATPPAPAAPTDPQIADIAYTAGQLDIAQAQQALQKATNPAVKSFAQTMVRDHTTVNDQALALVKKLGVTPEDNPTSAALTAQAAAKLTELATLSGADYDRAYVANEVAYHASVNAALQDTLIPAATNPELKTLLQTGLTLFRQHQAHAEELATQLK